MKKKLTKKELARAIIKISKALNIKEVAKIYNVSAWWFNSKKQMLRCIKKL